MSRNVQAATPAADRHNIFNSVFDRVSPDGLRIASACRTLNHIYRGLYGITTISQILIANGVAEDSDEIPLSGTIVGGLLDAVNALSSLMMCEIDRLSDHAQRSAEGGEVRHG
ncbi:hypothetical protein KPA94_23100 [Burkholderia semiarida]|uniref:hypothetical protein n=1 Tax=Burkholderia semiarida TaxID=2843303 RepID=UPI0023DD889E|nr:hypothetical protein [Burkholderia semiarida]MDF3116322.1 hypothetical protein [Burkholderia semiarida]